MQYDLMKYARQKTWKVFVTFTLCLLCGFSAVVSLSQATQQFTGHVLDFTGAVIPATRVVVHNQATGVDAKTVTTNTGDHTVTYLIPETYDITVSKEGFAVVKKTDILLNVDQISTIDFKLQVVSNTHARSTT
jgi:hypothetical protein